MTALSIWMRRCTAARAFPALVAFALVVVYSRGGWQYEWGWGLERAGSAAGLLAVVAAGLAAHDRARLAHPTLTSLAAAAPRGQRGLLASAASTWIVHVCAWLVAVLVVAVRVLGHAPGGAPDPLELVQPPVALAAGTALGTMVGALLPNLAAGPVATIATYLLALFGLGNGPDLFRPGDAVGTLIGLRPDPVLVIGAVVVHMALALASLSVAVAGTSVVTWPRAVAVVTALVLVVAGVAQDRQGDREAYVDAGWGTTCTGTSVVVCGPTDGGTVLRLTQRSLADAIDRLGPSGIAWQMRYRYEDGAVDPTGSGVVEVSPETFVDERLSADEIGLALGRPRMCAGFGDPGDEALLNDVSRVMDWVTHVLDAPVVPPAPAEVKAAYAALSTCPLATAGAQP
ncbi:hypothetical protein GCM10028814_13380 [Angustibacter aerolatus]